MASMRIVPAGLLAALLLLPACGGGDDDDASGGPAEGDDGAGSDDQGAGDDGTAGDDGGPGAETMCDGEIDIVSSDPVTLASSSSLAVTDGGAVFVAFSGPAQTTGGANTSAMFVTQLGTDGWSEPELVSADPDQAHTAPVLTAEGETLHAFWSMTRADGEGNEIMYASRTSDGQWSAPLDLTADENQESRASTSVRDAAVSSTGQLVIAYGSVNPADARRLESIRLRMVDDGAATTVPLDVAVGDFGCGQASVTFDSADLVHVAASCYDDADSASAFLSYEVGDGIGWLSEAHLRETLFSLNTSPSMAPLADEYVGLVWESRQACASGQCGHVIYATNAVGGFPPELDVSGDPARDPGDRSPS
ncbi:MAG TPA: hypothetical protein VKB80_12510, partial [Kofleriaceae bacterium]|nr:hypothetical protein [Kofleriaceae bacterium]